MCLITKPLIANATPSALIDFQVSPAEPVVIDLSRWVQGYSQQVKSKGPIEH
jgi:hypothetical protein